MRRFDKSCTRCESCVVPILVALVALAHPGFATSDDPPAAAKQARPRARDLGITIGILPTGELNAITDVPGVRVGHRSLILGDDVRTGVTAILPHGGNIFQRKVPAAVHVANGFGKLVGSTQIEELGVLESPIVLTNTLSAFAAADAIVAWSLQQKGNEDVISINAVVGECNDGYLNDIRGQHVQAEDVVRAISDAKSGPVGEGCVGAGVGTRCLGWKGGIGSSSRKLPTSLGGYVVGALVQTNFDGQLTIHGAPVGQELGRYFLKDSVPKQEPGSCMVIVATNAPLDARQLNRLAKRATLGLAAVGSPISHGSGDYIIAFSTAESNFSSPTSSKASETKTVLRDDRLSPLFQAVREATEEAVVNSLLKATTTTGRNGRTVDAIDPDDVVRICRKFGVISKP
jgi:D-aminopeptidase